MKKTKRLWAVLDKFYDDGLVYGSKNSWVCVGFKDENLDGLGQADIYYIKKSSHYLELNYSMTIKKTRTTTVILGFMLCQ